MLTLTADDLLACLDALPPVPLLGLTLLRQAEAAADGRWFPTGVATEQIVTATLELLAYSETCRHAAQRLSHLTPLPCAVPLMEYPL